MLFITNKRFSTVSSFLLCFFLFQPDTVFAHGSDPNVRRLWQFMNEQKQQNWQVTNKINELLGIVRDQENQINEVFRAQEEKINQIGR